MQNLNIPKKLHHIWVGHRQPPLMWMDTWKQQHPDWEYKLWGNKELLGRVWVNQKHIDWMARHEMWAGVADLMRYEILFEEGGFIAPADSICLRPIDELFIEGNCDAYSVFENEKVRAGLVSPLLASSKGSQFAKALVVMLTLKEQVGEPWLSTGNRFMQHAIGVLDYQRLKLWPSFYFIPEHYSGERYEGQGTIYATHEWGSHGGYDKETTK